MANALFELGLEDIPARFISNCITDLKTRIEKKCHTARISTSDTTIKTYATHRRLAIILTDLLPQQPELHQQIDGPGLAISRDDAGQWLPPAIGFAKKYGVSPDDLGSRVNDKGQPIVTLETLQPGQPTNAVLSTIFCEAVHEMPLPIAMVWGNGVGPFIRPIKWICALFDNHGISGTLFNVNFGTTTYGHRFLTQGDTPALGASIPLSSPTDYVDALAAHHVCVCAATRRERIGDQLRLHTDVHDNALLDEVVYLAESPVVLPISFDPTFLELPHDVLTACLKKHQKAFLVHQKNTLEPSCLIIADSITDTNRESVIAGNKRVMQARLTDAQFFWTMDIQKNGFSTWNNHLKNRVFQDGMGSVFDKVERTCYLCNTIIDQIQESKSFRDIVARAAHRCKADLASEMVMEFPELQGTMGAYYAIVFRELPSVALAIRDHYKPRYDGDTMPETLAGAVLSIADRIDTIITCFENNAIPTGSRDPWGIRRAMIAIARIIIHFNMPLNIMQCLEDATLVINRPLSDRTQECAIFFKQRLKTVWADYGISSDMFDWVSDYLLSNTLLAYTNSCQLATIQTESPDDYALLVETAHRVARIVPSDWQKAPILTQMFCLPIETEAYTAFANIPPSNGAFNETLYPHLMVFCRILANYFDTVLIHSDNPDESANRRQFMAVINDYFNSFGNWSCLKKHT
jgi:glycyl-tRNA synthetase beta chain